MSTPVIYGNGRTGAILYSETSDTNGGWTNGTWAATSPVPLLP